jgi:CDP-2,3-bis-(O-geranylgeranyl)-sn-glycerol synthase
MHWLLDLKLLLLIGIANGTPILLQKFFGSRFAFPVDGGRRLGDGQRLLGHSKSVRGVVTAVLAAAPLLGLGWAIGALVGATAMLGDMISSFAKRRMKLPPSSMALGLDQVPESLIPLLACAPFIGLAALDIACVVATFFVLELLLSKLLFRLHVRERPY